MLPLKVLNRYIAVAYESRAGCVETRNGGDASPHSKALAAIADSRETLWR